MSYWISRRIFILWPCNLIFLLSAMLTLSTDAHASPPASWKDSGYSLNAGGMTLKDVLSNFASSYGVNLSMSMPAQNVLKGRLSAQSGIEFLDRLALTYHFLWFVYNDTLYVSSLNEQTSLRLEVGDSLVPDAKGALTGIGLFEPRFGWGEIPSDGAVVVTGPRTYVDLVKSILLPSGKRADSNERTLMVFRLKYSSAADREVSIRDKTEVIPGVKTILSGLLQNSNSPGNLRAGSPISPKQGGQGNNAPGFADTQSSGALGQLSGEATRQRNGKNAYGYPTSKGERAGANFESGLSNAKSSKYGDSPGTFIQADPSQNAVIIYDNIEKKEMYQAFINELDVEPKQIEIEAVILDVTRSALSELGAEWSFSVGNLNATLNNTGADSQGTALPLAASSLLIKNTGSFYARLLALENKNAARILGRPTVLTIENIAAILDLSTSRYVSVSGQYYADLANITAGTMLRVVPRIVQDGDSKRVRLDISIENGDITGQEQDSTNVKRDTVSTQAIVEPNHTLLIGGMQTESKSSNKNRIPFLSDIPIIGKIFENHTSNNSTRERLFLITPRIVDRNLQPAPPQSHAAEQSETFAKGESLRQEGK